MIEMGKTYRTRDGREVRIYALDGGMPFSVHGAILNNGAWHMTMWGPDGNAGFSSLPADLIPADPHGILPRHRELLASVLNEHDYALAAMNLRSSAEFGMLEYHWQAALIALARLDWEKGE